MKNTVVVPANTAGASRIGSNAIEIGGPPACATKLVTPETRPASAVNHFGTTRACMADDDHARCAMNSKVITPSTADTAFGVSTPNNRNPTTVPARPAGSSTRSNARSRSRINAARPNRSPTVNSGSTIAAACGTGITSAISGTARMPKPPATPLLPMPTSSAAGTATA